MSLLSELNAIMTDLDLLVETGKFQFLPNAAYVVLTPLSDSYDIHADNAPGIDVQEVRVSLFTKGNYTTLKNKLIRAFRAADLTITDRRYVGHDDATGYHNYAIDVANYYELEE